MTKTEYHLQKLSKFNFHYKINFNHDEIDKWCTDNLPEEGESWVMYAGSVRDEYWSFLQLATLIFACNNEEDALLFNLMFGDCITKFELYYTYSP
jgi:hypothetical protein